MMQRTTINLDGRLIDLQEGVVMAIINVTPDSFFSSSRTQDREDLKRKIDTALHDGAEIIDIGGYSSRPGAGEVDGDEEIHRVAWAMEVLRRDYPQVAVSVDTFRSGVVRTIIAAYGKVIVNDISAGELDCKMVETVARCDVPYIAMHMRGTPETMNDLTDYGDIIDDLLHYFIPKLKALDALKVKDIVIDPGFGFAKTVRQNFELLKRMNELQVLDRPLLAGVSRKAMVWKTLGITPQEALNGTTAVHWEALRQGALILRAHDVREAVQTLKLYRACRQA